MSEKSYIKTTELIDVEVTPRFMEEASSFDKNIFSWSYKVKITNNRKRPVQLINRIWYIKDMNGNIYNVRGKGVIGEQPVIFPAEVYNYQSWTNIMTIEGIMYGSYEMCEVKKGAKLFTINIPEFKLKIANNIINLEEARNKIKN